MKKTLQEITGQSGILCYGKEVIACNWAEQEGAFNVLSERYIDDIRDALPGNCRS